MSATPHQGEAETGTPGTDPFEEGPPRGLPTSDDGAFLIVDLDGFEGPLDVLLTLARNQKVDLTRISILKLAEQYLDFINRAHRMELDLAADYLVMAAWLAYLKSRLLLPPPDVEEGPSGAEMAARLAFQLQRLESMRNAARGIFARKQLGLHVFRRGAPEGVRVVKTSEYQGTLYELLKAYSDQRLKGHETHWEPKRLPILAIEVARKRLEQMLGMMFDWGRIDAYLPVEYMSGEMRRSALASTFSAALVLAKDGEVELRQTGAYQPLFMRRKKPEDLKPEE
ncbi:MAG: ScpA family protein [Parvibaculum sp.]|jgi:segregation and condensation protein A|uniref:segregation and condensation protein A n=1 Tax=Parvibaculum sp. TaxID=2024848 RepID=UPI0028457728|nr:ScpA family protein [Parvibaculum sp.]MDR3498699.1 ScpA family protein [Parvibaculum sp.]